MKKTIQELKDVKFPDCFNECLLAEMCGVSECDNVEECVKKNEIEKEGGEEHSGDRLDDYVCNECGGRSETCMCE